MTDDDFISRNREQSLSHAMSHGLIEWRSIMATKLTKPVTRETDVTKFDAGKHREIVVTLQGEAIIFKLKGTRRTYSLPIIDAHNEAWDNAHADLLKSVQGRRK